MRIPLIVLFSGFFFILSCGNGQSGKKEKEKTEVELILDSIATHFGSEIIFNAQIGFGLKNKLYTVTHSGNEFEYTCFFSTDSGRYEQRLNGLGFTEKFNRLPVALSANDSLAKADSLNMEVIMALLPSILLNNKDEIILHGNQKIEGKDYRVISVAMNKPAYEKEAQFVLWFEQKSFALDFIFIPSFGKSNGVFASSKNSRRVNGVVFQDYDLYEVDEDQEVEHLPEIYLTGRLPFRYSIDFNRLSVVENSTLVSEGYRTDNYFHKMRFMAWYSR